MAKTRLAVLFGGISVEHEVSIITGQQLLKHANPETYDLLPIYIDKAGHWWTGAQLLEPSYFKTADLFQPAGLTPFQLNLNRDTNEIDAAILCFHGAYGEAGSVQGALELAGVPYQGPGVTGSAAAFDKIMTRQILAAEQVTQPAFTWFTLHEWNSDPESIKARVAKLKYPVFVKPANGGSTVGIEKVTSDLELISAIDRVAAFDQRIIVETEIKDCIEVNVSVLGLEGETRASVPEQPIKSDEFLSYADKYERGGGKKSGMASASRRIPAPISAELTEKLQELAQRLFHIFDCSGVVRIDFFVDPSEGSIYVVELNTIPGSMSFYLWEATGLPYAQLIDRLVAVALQRYEQQEQLTTSFDSNILRNRS